MYNKVYGSRTKDEDYVVPVELGGTGATTATGARTNLRLASFADLGATIARLNANKTIDTNVLPPSVASLPDSLTNTVKGPTSVARNGTITLTITDYDSSVSYVAQAVSGTVTLNGPTITYTAGSKLGAQGFTLNGRSIPITVTGNSPSKPTITSPTDATTGLPTSLTATTSAFSMTGGVDTHASSDWMLAKDPSFATPDLLLFHNANKISLALSGLALNTAYYLRARHRGASTGPGAWSNTIYFKTAGYPAGMPATVELTIPSGGQIRVTVNGPTPSVTNYTSNTTVQIPMDATSVVLDGTGAPGTTSGYWGSTDVAIYRWDEGSSTGNGWSGCIFGSPGSLGPPSYAPSWAGQTVSMTGSNMGSPCETPAGSANWFMQTITWVGVFDRYESQSYWVTTTTTGAASSAVAKNYLGVQLNTYNFPGGNGGAATSKNYTIYTAA